MLHRKTVNVEALHAIPPTAVPAVLAAFSFYQHCQSTGQGKPRSTTSLRLDHGSQGGCKAAHQGRCHRDNVDAGNVMALSAQPCGKASGGVEHGALQLLFHLDNERDGG